METMSLSLSLSSPLVGEIGREASNTGDAFSCESSNTGKKVRYTYTLSGSSVFPCRLKPGNDQLSDSNRSILWRTVEIYKSF